MAGKLRHKARGLYREAILEAAETVFSRKGFSGARMSDVAEQAGLATGTLYNYFQNKQDVFGSLIELRSRSFLAELIRVEAAHQAPLERVRQLLAASFGLIERHRGVFAVFLELGITTGTEAHRVCGGDHESTHRQSMAIFQRALGDAIAAGDISSAYEAAELNVYLHGAMQGAIHAWLEGDDSERLADRVDGLFRLFLHGAAA